MCAYLAFINDIFVTNVEDTAYPVNKIDQLSTLMDTKKESVLTKSMMKKGVH